MVIAAQPCLNRGEALGKALDWASISTTEHRDTPPNICVWDLQDHVCLQPFCGKLFAPGNCPVTSAYFHPNDNTLVCSTFSPATLSDAALFLICASSGLSSWKPALIPTLDWNPNRVLGDPGAWERTGEDHTYSSPLCAILYNTNVKQTLAFFHFQQIRGIIHMNKVFHVTGWSRRVTYFMIHKTGLVLLYHHWPTFHREDVLSMGTYQSQCLGTSSCSGDILFWNINTFKPIFGFNASVSALPQSPKEVQEVDECVVESSRPSKPCVGHKRWAYKTPKQPQGRSTKTVANVNLRRNLMSAPPVM
ncbi:uncharacterized protein LOC130683989 [Manis pentadactyla]|uniref:uncharacterized protein LOC130683989 n=1 Tax=Manis pentadactyla TaxID=143292 RepID=UPI00255C7869|nr:uncharacterized protein LOC130683989 [Manis pentadactyla]